MGTVNVSIAGKSYRMACGDGEEAHLEGLAAMFDARIEEMRRSLGELGDMRLHVMAALTIADELSVLRGRIDALERKTDALQAETTDALQRADTAEQRAMEAMSGAAQRIERVARLLAPSSG